MQSSSVTLQSLLHAMLIATRLLWRHAVDGVSTWSCELRQIEWSSLPLLSYNYTAPTALGINIEQIRANVFLFNVFKRFLFCPRFLRFLTFFTRATLC